MRITDPAILSGTAVKTAAGLEASTRPYDMVDVSFPVQPVLRTR